MLTRHPSDDLGHIWATTGVAQLSEGVVAKSGPLSGERRQNDGSPAFAGLSLHAPKRTRTSTRLARTRPSTWRVYQFRHRRGNGEYSPGVGPGLSPSAGGDTVCEHTFDHLWRRPRPAWTLARI